MTVRARDVLALALAALLALGFVKLGLWQLERRVWKENLLASMEQAVAGKAPELAVSEAQRRLSDDPAADYVPVAVTGRFVEGQDRYLYSIVDGKPGWHVLTPLLLGDSSRVIVDRGAIPDEMRGQTILAPPQGSVSLHGFARRGRGRAAWFEPVNDPARNRWYQADIPALLESLPADPGHDIPVLVLAAPQSFAGDWPRPERPDPASIPNNHLQYALTWFALAGLLIVLTGVYAGSRRRPDR